MSVFFGASGASDGDLAVSAAKRTAGVALRYAVCVAAIAIVFVFLVESLSRGSVYAAFAFMRDPRAGAWATVLLVGVVLFSLDAIIGRSHQAICTLGPLLLILPFASCEKLHYLSDPLFPTDFLFVRQVAEIGPLIVDTRPMTTLAAAVAIPVVLTVVILLLTRWRHAFPRARWRGRVARLAVALPALFFFYSISDYGTYSRARDRMHIIPKMWDQKANYAHNGFIMAFAINVPMSRVDTPVGYSKSAMETMRPSTGVSVGKNRPDVVMVMSESFWDPTKLPNVELSPDPMPTIRSMQSGLMFSPEFGGMTADIEFEALTGFSNAFLPYGSIPYQQFIRRPTPSLARFFNDLGYVTRAIHPFQAWFWNRGTVYRNFDFDLFKSEENLPKLSKRGPLASDAALTGEIIKEADAIRDPFFFFVVTLQGHGPYEAHRYPDETIRVDAPKISEGTRQSLASYAQGIKDADTAFARLVDWAKRRDRETILVFFGDHLPPMGPVYVETGFLKHNVAPRKAPPAQMLAEHGTPLVVWSNRKGVIPTGAISPSQMPREILQTAGMTHPFYTGFLGEVREHYRVVERQLLLEPDGRTGVQDWVEKAPFEPVIDDYRRLQYDVMLGKSYAKDRFFPTMKKIPATSGLYPHTSSAQEASSSG